MRTAPISFAILLEGLEAYRRLVHALASSSWVLSHELTVRAPLLRATPELTDRARAAPTSLDKFDLYLDYGFVDEDRRRELAAAFRTDYARRHPGGNELCDIHLASADVLRFDFELKNPAGDPNVLRAIRDTPHDPRVFEMLVDGKTLDPSHRRGSLLLFLEDIENRRHWSYPEVAAARRDHLATPIVPELQVARAIPAFFVHVLEPLVAAARGALVYISG